MNSGKDKENIDRIDVLLERKKKNITDLTEKKKADPAFVNKLQGQITQSTNKISEINHRCNLLEQKNKQAEEKCQKLTENNKSLSEEVAQKDKEIKGLNSKIGYIAKEKQTLEDKLKESKAYINKLEQRILKNSKTTQKTAPTVGSYKTFETDEEGGSSPSLGKLQEIIENQKYEIKLLTQTLHDKETKERETPSLYSPHTHFTEEDHHRDAYEHRQQAFDKLAHDYQTLSSRYKESQEVINSLRNERDSRDQDVYIRDEKYERIMKDTESIRSAKESVERERNSLYKYAEELNSKIRSLTEEVNCVITNILIDAKHLSLQKAYDEIQLNGMSGQTKLLHDIDAKNVEIRQLTAALNQEKAKVNELEQRLSNEMGERKGYTSEVDRLGKIDEINQLLKQEIFKLKELIQKYEKEVDFFKKENEGLKKEKDSLRTELENYGLTNSTIQQSIESPSLQNLQVIKIQDELEQVESEKNKIKETLNQVISELDTFKAKQNDHDEALKRKEKQIENLVNSRNMMQSTLGDQVLIKEKENKRLKEENLKHREDIDALREENIYIRDLLRKQEKFIHENSAIITKSKY